MAVIIWHVETSSGPRFEYARDEEHQRRQMIDYYNECLAGGADEELADDTEFEDVREAIEEHENFSEDELYGVLMEDDWRGMTDALSKLHPGEDCPGVNCDVCRALIKLRYYFQGRVDKGELE